MFANAVRCSERSGVRVSKRSGRVFGFVFCSALFLNCSVFCFVRPFRGCVLFGCFVRVFPPIVSLFGCFDWRNDRDLGDLGEFRETLGGRLGLPMEIKGEFRKSPLISG